MAAYFRSRAIVRLLLDGVFGVIASQSYLASNPPEVFSQEWPHTIVIVNKSLGSAPAAYGALDPEARKFLDAKFTKAFGPGATAADRQDYYRSALDPYKSWRSAKEADAEALHSQKTLGNSPSDRFFAELNAKARESEGVDARQEAVMTIGMIGDADLQQGALIVAERYDASRGGLEGTEHLKKLATLMRYVVRARDGGVFEVANDQGKMIPVTFFRDHDVSRKAAERLAGGIVNAVKAAQLMDIDPSEFDLLLSQLELHLLALGNSAPLKVVQAECTLKQLTATYAEYAASIRRSLVALAGGARLQPEAIVGIDARGEAVSMKDAAGNSIQIRFLRTNFQHEALIKASRQLDLKVSLREALARLEVMLRRDNSLAEADVTDMLRYLRARATADVVQVVWQLEVSGIIAPGDCERFFCDSDPITGATRMIGLDGDFLAKAFARYKVQQSVEKKAGPKSPIPARRLPNGAASGAN